MQIKKFDSINVVPFIDIMLVLLVIVLTTASFVAKGIIPVDLPDASAAQKQKEQKNLTITIKKSGEILFDKQQVLKEDLEKMLLTYKKDTAIAINCDKKAEFEIFVYLLDILESNQFKNLGIVTKKAHKGEVNG
ncbi:biopolymer transporter ExbD [Sulfurimonas sp. C5]|uniref:ExbD/TolR family protein n=1 Tax=Sulfurimonas sp. C5 TaxID=3036947 RepID=UPI002458A5E5|nr:biopolymer transporter ExbD [Sulfurimonas sp. C5]MDH4944129.1 biopolymer transporter ExbD [Sulfurimonas sp. C5]